MNNQSHHQQLSDYRIDVGKEGVMYAVTSVVPEVGSRLSHALAHAHATCCFRALSAASSAPKPPTCVLPALSWADWVDRSWIDEGLKPRQKRPRPQRSRRLTSTSNKMVTTTISSSEFLHPTMTPGFSERTMSVGQKMRIKPLGAIMRV
ncbi:hypothetical protein KCV07_g88, partial [Aureobasidium melanogenum]